MADFEYSVKQSDKGLSYIILEEAKKNGFDTNKNIDWYKVMSVFDKIQTEKQKHNEKLYSGGNDKTSTGYKTSYIIEKGDNIKLSEQEMNEIYDAMGLDITKKKGENLSQKAMLPPAEENQQFFGTSNSEKTLKSGNTIKFNINGQKDEVRDSNKRLIRKYYYSDTKNPTLTQNEKYSYINYEYDNKGRKSREIYIDINGNVVKYSDFVYDQNGKKTEIKRNPDGSLRN